MTENNEKPDEGLGLAPVDSSATSWSSDTTNSTQNSWTKQNFAQVLLTLQARLLNRFNDFPPVTEEEIVKQSKAICRDYIYSKLKALKLVHKEIHHDGKCSDISRELIQVAQEYELMYPNLFADVCNYLRMNFEYEDHVQGVFNVVASEIIGRGISWARIIALFAFTATLAVDCIQQENTRFANLVVDCMQKFTKKRLAPWILQRGGWLGMVHYLHNNHIIQPKMWKVRCIASAVGFVATTAITILETIAAAVIGGDDQILN
ncbi:bcl-2-related ovarian killer protein-like [Anneissia japonica]|uniref:bcl-2-related ovarian killer protein-like n=1 Tax=Anneissia japonica TaxID=1529436 RepID=UPI001425885E|nr:bcl-2-related ovarian killer protein-like [Anneissia japonica]